MSTCWMCKGSRKVWWADWSDPTDGQWDACEECNGTGAIKDEVDA